MPHYKSGRQAQVGDLVVAPAYGGEVLLGTVSQVQPGSDSCNLMLIELGRALHAEGRPLVFARGVPAPAMGAFTASQCERIDLPT